MKKLGIIGGGMILSAALLVSSAGAVLASGSETAPAMTATAQGEQNYQGIFGTVSEIEGDTITLDSNSLGEVEILLDSETIYKVPGKEDASLEDIVKDVRLAILATPGAEEGVFTADRIMMVPDGATHRHMNGVVVATQEKTMTMMNNSGDTFQVNLPEGVQVGAVGDFISVAVQNSAGEGACVASGLQNATMVQERLMNQISELDGQGSGAQAQVQNRERLCDLCEGLAERHMQVLNDVLDKAPEEARECIQLKINSQEQVQEQIHQAINGGNAGSGGQNPN